MYSIHGSDSSVSDDEDSQNSYEHGLAMAQLLPSLGAPLAGELSRLIEMAPPTPDDPHVGPAGTEGPVPIGNPQEANPPAQPLDIVASETQMVAAPGGDPPGAPLARVSVDHVQIAILMSPIDLITPEATP